MALHPLVNIGIRAARRAGNVIFRSLNRLESLEVSAKGRNDFVTDVDRSAEQEIIATIRRAYPDHGFLAEESGTSAGKSDEFVWIIDPLDGTTNFLHGFPQFCVSIAVQHRGRIEHAVIYDPMRQELFTASSGQGAQLDDRKLRVSKSKGARGRADRHGLPVPRQPQVARQLHGDVQGRHARDRRAAPAGLGGARPRLGRGRADRRASGSWA